MKHRGRGANRTPDLEWRRQATLRTVERYQGKAFDWSAGVTCVHLARFHLRQMGHRTPTMPRFRSALLARRALEERGWDSVAAMFDSMLPRITPAGMMLGDIAVVPGEGFDAILVCVGPRRVFGWHQDCDVPVMGEPNLAEMVGAWRG